MWKRIISILLIILSAAAAIISCAEIPRPRERDLMEERYQEYRLQEAIREQSG